ncbi:Splicing factor U2AF subunit [Candida viswanathii]|uniref:Splicing factor U2AF subunit n=1 Tax=Candida viswanathii TaxID=5486 RepID=A0A367XSP9_9ASCO|nr:Splicing factor U2AF subunit [Candida viswanathii]
MSRPATLDFIAQLISASGTKIVHDDSGPNGGPPQRKRARTSLYNGGEGLLLCWFYTKVGACHHGEKCVKRHINPTTSYTIKLSNLYDNPLAKKRHRKPAEIKSKKGPEVDETVAEPASESTTESTTQSPQENTDRPAEDTSISLQDEPEVELTEDEIQANFDYACNTELNSEWFNEKPVYSSLSPVSDFGEALCHEYDSGDCERDGNCNYMHLRYSSPAMQNKMFRSQERTYLTKRLLKLRKELPVAGDINQLGKEVAATRNGTNSVDQSTRTLLQQLY